MTDGGVEGGLDANPQQPTGIHRVDDAVIPQPGAGIVGVALALELVANPLGILLNLLFTPCFILLRQALLFPGNGLPSRSVLTSGSNR